jgi:hypothetical protein
MMDHGMMQGGTTMWGMGVIGLLVVIALILLIATFVKYLFVRRQDRHASEGMYSQVIHPDEYPERGGILKDDRQHSSWREVMVKLIRSLLAILVATVLIGAPAVQATIDMPCHMVVATGDQVSSAQAPDPMPAPCKGTMPGCADMFVCGLSAALPTHVTVASHKLLWTLAAYGAVADSREGLSVQPDLVPPITI